MGRHPGPSAGSYRQTWLPIARICPVLRPLELSRRRSGRSAGWSGTGSNRRPHGLQACRRGSASVHRRPCLRVGASSSAARVRGIAWSGVKLAARFGGPSDAPWLVLSVATAARRPAGPVLLGGRNPRTSSTGGPYRRSSPYDDVGTRLWARPLGRLPLCRRRDVGRPTPWKWDDDLVPYGPSAGFQIGRV